MFPYMAKTKKGKTRHSVLPPLGSGGRRGDQGGGGGDQGGGGGEFVFCLFYLTHFLFATKLKSCMHQLKNNWKTSGYLLIFEILFVGTVLGRLSNLNNSFWYNSPFFFLVIGLSISNLDKTLQQSLQIIQCMHQ